MTCRTPPLGSSKAMRSGGGKQRGGSRGPLPRCRTPLADETRRWVLQFGHEAEVLKPVSLRKEVAKDLAAALAAYRSKP